MLKYFFILLLGITNTIQSQSIVGEWETYDDVTGIKKSVVEIYKENNKYFGKITNLLVDPIDSVCEECEGNKKNKPLIGLVILENLIFQEEEYDGGTITDPENGKSYKCNIVLENKHKLKVRGYIGFSLFGRTQYWIRKQ